MSSRLRFLLLSPFALLLLTGSVTLWADEPAVEIDQAAVSYADDVLPIFQAKCQGCHQPSKALGGYNMLSFDALLKGGESGLTAVVPGKPNDSYLIDQIALDDNGDAEMPKDLPPLSKVEIDTVRRWIEQGATNDAPSTGPLFDAKNPPVYTRPPVVTGLAYSPDGKLIAVAGYHEVLLHNADGSGLVRRLVGLSERIEAVSFSPDGTRLAVVGGRPGRSGEVQVWEVKSGELSLSQPATFDTIYGVSWSPDGKFIAFGAADNTLRAIDAATGEQVLYQAAHNDWVRDTVWTVDGKHLVSVSRDMTTKLVEVETERFVDNITSITPKALKGGINAIDRHPAHDSILIGGADGTPKIYRIFRQTARQIGDDANLIRRYPEMPGRIFAVAFSQDGKRIVAGSSLNGTGMVRVYRSEFDPTLPKDIKAILAKRVASQNAMEKAKVEQYVTQDTEIVTTTALDAGVYAVVFAPDGKTVAAAGSDGLVRLIDAATGEVRSSFMPVNVTPDAKRETIVVEKKAEPKYDMASAPRDEPQPKQQSITSLIVSPPTIQINHPFDYAQLVIRAESGDGQTFDVTRFATVEMEGKQVAIDVRKLVTPIVDGTTVLTVRYGDQVQTVPVKVSGMTSDRPISYVRDVNPIIGRLGCNQGTCHGAKDGKNGFKLSLRGYDPIYDLRAFTDDLASRRVNVASPDASLMLMKASGRVPHVGGQLTTPGEPYYEAIRRWIAEGATLDAETARVLSIRLEPENPVVQQIGTRQQLRVIASYADGTERDVTREAFIDSGNTDIADTEGRGLIRSLRRGEAPLLARYEGSYAATTLTVMGDRDGFKWQPGPKHNRIDELVEAKLQRMKINPSGLAGDAEFLRRVTLDLTGLPPTADEVRAFLSDNRDPQVKRKELIDRLIGSEDFVDQWTNKWADLLQVNRKFLGTEGSKAFRAWIREQVKTNRPYNEFVYDILTASGSNRENPAASYYKILRDPADTMENTTHLFLAIRFNCNKCHDHPFERWTQDQYYETAAFFAQVGLKADPEAKGKRIGGTAVEGAKPLYEVIYDKPEGEMTHDRTGSVTAPEFPFEETFETARMNTRREQLAMWMTSPENPYFAKSYVNRLWGYMLGVGLIEPLDDIRAGNPPSNPELLDYLTEEFVQSGFDTRHVLRLITQSATYQRTIATNEWNADDATNYSHAIARRLPAEVIYDAIHRALDSTPNIPGVPKGTRAAQLPDAGVKLPSGFLANLGRPSRESACECERSDELQLGPVMALIGGPVVGDALSDSNNALAKLTTSEKDDRTVINEIFLRLLNRPATDQEFKAASSLIDGLDEEHAALVKQKDAYLASIAEREKTRVKQRADNIARAKAARDAYAASIQQTREKAEADRKAKIEQLTADLQKYRQSLLPKANEWAAGQSAGTNWTALRFETLAASMKSKLTQASDFSVMASGPNGKGVYTLTTKLDLQGVTGIRLEALADPKLPRKGPGRSSGGNFVVTEFEILTMVDGKLQSLKLTNAKATFNQGGYDINTAIDGKQAPAGNGWAIAGGTSKDQTAVIEIATPLADAGEQPVTFKLHQGYQDGTHSLGKFRISVTRDAKPFKFGLPGDISGVIAVAADQRTKEQKQTLLAYFAKQDATYKQKATALANAKKPLPADPKLTELNSRLAEFEKPLTPDPQAVRLKRAVELSAKQLQNARLTAAQDLAWALINSPAFLFNR